MTFSRFLSLVHLEDRERVRESTEKAKTGEDMSIEYRVKETPENFAWITSRGRIGTTQ